MYVQIIIFLYMIISLKSRIYLTGWNERIGGKRVGAGRDLSERVVFPYILPIDFRAFSLSSRRFGHRARRVIPAVVATPKPSVRFHVHFRNAHSIFHLRVSVARIILPLSSFHGPRYEISSKTRYNLFLFFLFLFSLFFSFALNIISFLKSLLYHFPSSFCSSSHYVDSLLR